LAEARVTILECRAVTLRSRCGHSILPLWFLLFFFLLCRAIYSQLRHASTVGKSFEIAISSPHVLHNMVNFDPLAAEIGSLVWGTPTISAGFVSWRRYCSDVAHRKPTKLWTMFGRLLGHIHCIYRDSLYTFLGLLPRNGILPDAKFTLRSSLALSYIGSVTARHSSSGRQPNYAAMSRGRPPPIFDRAAITLDIGIGPHSSFLMSIAINCNALYKALQSTRPQRVVNYSVISERELTFTFAIMLSPIRLSSVCRR